MKLNNVDMTAVGALAERAKQDPAVLRMQKRVEGSWSSGAVANAVPLETRVERA